MNIVGIGTDIVDLGRVRDAKHLKRVSDFLFVKAETAELLKAPDKVQFVGSRLALKESIIKAYPGTLHYRDILLFKKGKKVHAKILLKKAQKLEIFVSLAHEFNCAIGYAILCES